MTTATLHRPPADEQPTMFGDVIAYLHGDQPRGIDKAVLKAATAIRDQWDGLDHAERMMVETMLAWAVMRAGKMVSIERHAHACTQSAHSLRRNVTAGTDGPAEALCALIEARLADMAIALAALQDGTAGARCQALLAAMQAAHPRLGLSFGYIGNCGFGPGGYDDRSWSFFAKLATPRCANACDVSFGGVTTPYLGKLMLRAEADLAAWCDEQERRLDAGEIRIVGADA